MFDLYLNDLKTKYGDSVIVNNSNFNKEILEKTPKALQPVYKKISKLVLPSGEIFTIDTALKISEQAPFNPNWFVFGKDTYFSFWLCLYEPDENGLSFTYWDHESRNKIDEAVYPDLISFLQEIEDDFEFN